MTSSAAALPADIMTTAAVETTSKRFTAGRDLIIVPQPRRGRATPRSRSLRVQWSSRSPDPAVPRANIASHPPAYFTLE